MQISVSRYASNNVFKADKNDHMTAYQLLWRNIYHKNINKYIDICLKSNLLRTWKIKFPTIFVTIVLIVGDAAITHCYADTWNDSQCAYLCGRTRKLGTCWEYANQSLNDRQFVAIISRCPLQNCLKEIYLPFVKCRLIYRTTLLSVSHV